MGMKTESVNISGFDVQILAKIRLLAASEERGNFAAMVRKLLNEALEARAEKAKKGV